MSKKCLVVGVVVLAAVVGGAFTVKSIERIGTGQLGVQYSVNGVKEDTLSEGWHFINPFLKVKEFSIGNEQLVLEKVKDDDASIKVATSDDASIATGMIYSPYYNNSYSSSDNLVLRKVNRNVNKVIKALEENQICTVIKTRKGKK